MNAPTTTMSTRSPAAGSESLLQLDLFPPAMSTDAASSMSEPTTSEPTDSVTSSPASEDGPTPSTLPAGVSERHGQVLAHVSRFRSPESRRAISTNDISGPLFSVSSPSAGLQSSLANRLVARLGTNGSPEFALTWRSLDMPAGLPICALRVSARRTSARGSTGWPTPDASVAQDGESLSSWEARREMLKQKGINGNGCGLPLTMAAQLAGWATPTSRDYKDGASTLENTPINGLLGRQVSLISAPTAKRAALNPAFSLWLMGFPTGWASCGARVMQSSRRSRRNSSRRSSTRR